jgi:hypothetical protein
LKEETDHHEHAAPKFLSTTNKPNPMKTRTLLSLSVLSLSLLQACGGGGGGGFPVALAPTSAASGQSEPESKSPEDGQDAQTPSTETPDTSPSPPPTDVRAPVPGSEPAPSLNAPQAGSTAEASTGFDGIYEATFGYTFITPQGVLARKDLLDWTWGSINIQGSDWAFNPDTRVRQGSFAEKTATGSGTFTAKTSMTGRISVDGREATKWGPLKYSISNALAIKQEALAGNWSVTERTNGGLGMAIEFDSAGGFTGTTAGSQIGVCKLTGAAIQATPGSARNLFYMTMTATNAASGTEKPCALDTTLPYAALSAVVLEAADFIEQRGYFRAFVFHARTANGAMVTNFLHRER